MKYSLRKKKHVKKTKTRNKNKNKNNKTLKNIGGAITASNIMDAYNTVNKTSQDIYSAYLGAKEKYDNIMQKYQDMQNKYQEMKQTLERIQNDPEVQQHLNTLSTIQSQVQQSLASPPIQTQNMMKQQGGFFNLGVGQDYNTYLTNKKQQAQSTYNRAQSVYNNPQVQQHMNDLSKHSYNTAKQGALFGVNVATAAPFSAAYRGYNTAVSAKKGITSAKNLYSSASDAYRSSVAQQNI